MIKGVHAMFYTPQADELRTFIRDKLNFSHTDVGDGWLIFDTPEVEIGCHPSDKMYHEMSFYCDDIHKTMAELQARGVEFTSEVKDAGFGLMTKFLIPGNTEFELYQPKYKKRPQAKLRKSTRAKTKKKK